MDKKLLGTGEETCLRIPCANQTVTVEAGEEFVLADYFPEVRRVVTTLCRVLPERSYDSGDTLRLGGTVSFTVLYIGDDGTLSAAPLTTEYSASVQMPEGDGCVTLCDTTVENVTCRATGPRRLTLRARLRATVTSHRKGFFETAVTAGGDSATAEEIISIQTLESEENSLRHAMGRLTGNVSGEFSAAPGVKPIICDGEIMVTDTSVSNGTVILRGEAAMWCLCYSPEGVYFKTVSKSPFEEKIPLEGGWEYTNGESRGFGRCASVTVKEGGEGIFLWDMEYDLECEAVTGVPVTVARDLYSTMHDSTVTRDEKMCLSPGTCKNGRLSVTGSARAAAEGSIIATYGTVSFDRMEREGDKLCLIGTAELHAVICGGGDATDQTVRVPVRYECDPGNMGDGEILFRCDGAVWDVGASLEGENLRIDGEVVFGFTVLEKHPVSYVSGLSLERNEAGDGEAGCVRIYFPEDVETPWDIGKRYRIPVKDVSEDPCGGVIIRK